MNKVTTINLNGRAYQVEEAGYELLRAYLDQAAAKLEGNPDKEEVMGDFEQAIAEKCGQYLSGSKEVIKTAEIEDIIAKMGPVEIGSEREQAAGGAAESSRAASGTRRRLYRVVEGQWIAGVCNGLGAYFNLDTTIVRILFVVLALLTHGFMVGVYIILAIVMPVARTEEDRERARGQAPFTANEFIEQAKQRYAEFQKNHPHTPATPADPTDKEAWRKWKDDMKSWKREWKADLHAEKVQQRAAWAETYRYERSGGGFFRFVLGLIVFGLFALWGMALWSVLARGIVLGYPVVSLAPLGSTLATYPTLFAITLITALFYVLFLPIKLLIKNTRPQKWTHYSLFTDLVQSIFFLFAVGFLVYAAAMLFPAVREAWTMLVTSIK